MEVESLMHSDVSTVTQGKRIHVGYPGERLLGADEGTEQGRCTWASQKTAAHVVSQVPSTCLTGSLTDPELLKQATLADHVPQASAFLHFPVAGRIINSYYISLTGACF